MFSFSSLMLFIILSSNSRLALFVNVKQSISSGLIFFSIISQRYLPTNNFVFPAPGLAITRIFPSCLIISCFSLLSSFRNCILILIYREIARFKFFLFTLVTHSCNNILLSSVQNTQIATRRFFIKNLIIYPIKTYIALSNYISMPLSDGTIKELVNNKELVIEPLVLENIESAS